MRKQKGEERGRKERMNPASTFCISKMCFFMKPHKNSHNYHNSQISVCGVRMPKGHRKTMHSVPFFILLYYDS